MDIVYGLLDLTAVILEVMVFIGIMLAAQFLFYRKYYGRIIVTTLTYMMFLTLIDYSTVAIMTCFSGMEFQYFQKMTLFRVGGIMISKGFLLVSVIFIQKKMENLKKLQRNYLFFLAAISALVLLFAVYMFQNFMQRNQILSSEAMIFLLLFLIEMLSFFCFSAMTENHEKKEKLKLLNLYNQMLLQSLEEERHNFELWSGRIHDYKNRMVYMKELLETQEYGKLRKYMIEETGILKKQCCYVQSGYAGIDAVINYKMMYAESQEIHMACNIHLPAGLSLDDGAMVVVLGNLLDNAIRAVQPLQKKFIEININYMKENMYIKIVNNKNSEEIDFENSSKENPQWHRIGLRSVKQQMKRLNGDFRLIQETGRVIAMAVIYEVK